MALTTDPVIWVMDDREHATYLTPPSMKRQWLPTRQTNILPNRI